MEIGRICGASRPQKLLVCKNGAWKERKGGGGGTKKGSGREKLELALGGLCLSLWNGRPGAALVNYVRLLGSANTTLFLFTAMHTGTRSAATDNIGQYAPTHGHGAL